MPSLREWFERGGKVEMAQESRWGKKLGITNHLQYVMWTTNRSRPSMEKMYHELGIYAITPLMADVNQLSYRTDSPTIIFSYLELRVFRATRCAGENTYAAIT